MLGVRKQSCSWIRPSVSPKCMQGNLLEGVLWAMLDTGTFRQIDRLRSINSFGADQLCPKLLGEIKVVDGKSLSER